MKDIRQQWKALAADRNINSRDMAALAIYRSLKKGEGKEGAISRLRKSFKPVTNTVCLENGAAPYHALYLALWGIKYSANLIKWLDEEDAQAILSLVKEIKIKGGNIE